MHKWKVDELYLLKNYKQDELEKIVENMSKEEKMEFLLEHSNKNTIYIVNKQKEFGKVRMQVLGAKALKPYDHDEKVEKWLLKNDPLGLFNKSGQAYITMDNAHNICVNIDCFSPRLSFNGAFRQSKIVESLIHSQLDVFFELEKDYYAKHEPIEIERKKLVNNYQKYATSFGLDIKHMYDANEIGVLDSIPYLDGVKLSLEQLKYINETYKELDSSIKSISKKVEAKFLEDKYSEANNENEVELD